MAKLPFLAEFAKYLLNEGKNSDANYDRTITSLNWYRNKVTSTKKSVSLDDITKDISRVRQTFEIGKMYHFIYNPKTKETMAYYDVFPLCIPFKFSNKGFLGLNLHYLAPKHRVILFNALNDFNNLDFKKEQRLKFTYELLTSSAKYKWFKPCIKKYLYSYLRSGFIKIDEKEWNSTLFLPTERFIKQRKEVVWKDSEYKVTGF